MPYVVAGAKFLIMEGPRVVADAQFTVTYPH
jgi:hypothetical protein